MILFFFAFSYKIMIECWHAEPQTRPSFTDLVNRIEILLYPPGKRPTPSQASDGTEGEPLYMNIRKTGSTDYLQPVDFTAPEAESQS